jgi:hypothetical protein
VSDAFIETKNNIFKTSTAYYEPRTDQIMLYTTPESEFISTTKRDSHVEIIFIGKTPANGRNFTI